MERRRLDLGMTWRQVETAAKLSYEGLRGIRRGDRNPSGLTARRLEDALGWEHGSIETIIAGGEPSLASQQVAANPQRAATVEQMETTLAWLRSEREKPGADLEDIDDWIGLLEYGLERRRRQSTG